MTNAPDHLYNLYLTYDLAATGTQLGAVLHRQGDTLVAGAGADDGNFVPERLREGVRHAQPEHLAEARRRTSS